MEYVLRLLERDLILIKRALKETSAWSKYPSAYKRQMAKVKALEAAIEILKE